MYMFCPSCNDRIHTRSRSRFHVFTCDCGRQFRGIDADVDIVHSAIWRVGQAIVPGWKQVLGRHNTFMNETMCPFCWCEIPLKKKTNSKGYYSPDCCHACGNELPTEPVNDDGDD